MNKASKKQIIEANFKNQTYLWSNRPNFSWYSENRPSDFALSDDYYRVALTDYIPEDNPGGYGDFVVIGGTAFTILESDSGIVAERQPNSYEANLIRKYGKKYGLDFGKYEADEVMHYEVVVLRGHCGADPDSESVLETNSKREALRVAKETEEEISSDYCDRCGMDEQRVNIWDIEKGWLL